MKYTAIKLRGLPHYLWFETGNIEEDALEFTATEGWGKNGALTKVRCMKSEIRSRIESDELQYN